jgi:hypothetical protein
VGTTLSLVRTARVLTWSVVGLLQVTTNNSQLTRKD